MTDSNKLKKKGRGKTGIEFEKFVSQVQQQFDPNSKVTHNVLLTDRLGHQRQFDVVIRGSFAGQQILGVMECKDLRRNVGIQDLEAFITKCNDINANIKVLVSSRGFTKKAIHKARHYGIQTLSLLPSKDSVTRSQIGTKWYADVYFWKRVAMELHFAEVPPAPVKYEVEDVSINGKNVLDWFKNYLIRNHAEDVAEGWIVNIQVVFGTPQLVTAGGQERLCTGITFHALRACERKSKTIGWRGTAFFDWQHNQLKPIPNATLSTDGIPIDFRTWDDRGREEIDESAFLYGHFTVFGKSFDLIPDAIDLEAVGSLHYLA